MFRQDLKISTTNIDSFIKFEAFFEGERIGFLLLYLLPPFYEESAQVYFVKVEKLFQRQGIITILHERAADWAFQHKMRLISAINTQMTWPAENFWIKQVTKRRAKRIFINRGQNIYFYALDYPPPATLQRNPADSLDYCEFCEEDYDSYFP